MPQLARQLGLAGLHRLQVDPTAHQLRLEDIPDGLHPLLAAGLHRDLVARPADGRVGALEVETLPYLPGSLIERVVDLLAVDLADDIEGTVCSHASILPSPADRL
ncbi:hypothetical protein SDC9_138805 [bioreactor metagenome]|uniref:Uncharacterized protein n=1 Tax=bioreactor metagenome TaxID=1076179 RepID=A0A645DSM7_9ZZZZ